MLKRCNHSGTLPRMPEPGSTPKQPAAAGYSVPDAAVQPVEPDGDPDTSAVEDARPRELGGPAGPDPTRYGDWERKGRCIDF